MRSFKKQTEFKIIDETNEILFQYKNGVKRIKIEPIMSSIMMEISGTQSFVSREELINKIWDGNSAVGNKSLTKNIYKIRKVFEENELSNPIETIPKKGYRLKLQTVNHRRPMLPMKRYTPAAIAIILALVLIKLIYPGVGHVILHRLLH
ncbi:MAG: winged helix-turn-helix domain-containing protein [Ekhidna sp.]